MAGRGALRVSDMLCVLLPAMRCAPLGVRKNTAPATGVTVSLRAISSATGTMLEYVISSLPVCMM